MSALRRFLSEERSDETKGAPLLAQEPGRGTTESAKGASNE
jgi:hypothetical protein